MNDSGGRGISIIPPQEVTDHISGNWCVYLLCKQLAMAQRLCESRFYIRSATNRAMYWHYRVNEGIFISDKDRTQILIKARNLRDGTIMIGADQITLELGPYRLFGVHSSRTIRIGGHAHEFKFEDFVKGNFLPEKDVGLIYDASLSRQESWELISCNLIR